MTPREIMRRTLDFDYPERVAHTYQPGDIVNCFHTAKTHATGWEKTGDEIWERTDEWGNRWRRIDPTSKGEVSKGALNSIHELDQYTFPDFSKPEYYQKAKQVRDDNPDMWLHGCMPGFAFNIARKLRRLDEYMMDLASEPDRCAELHNRIDTLLEDMIRNYGEIGCDSIGIPEDWGTQKRLLVSPKMWRREFAPRFEKLCGIVHEYGMKFLMHSCGQIEAVVPDMIACGVDCFQFDQPGLHGIDVLAGHQKNAKVTFWCPIDIQTTLQSGDEDTIRGAAREYLDKLWQGRGGFIAGYYGDNVSIGCDPQWQAWACDEFTKYGMKDNFAVTQ